MLKDLTDTTLYWNGIDLLKCWTVQGESSGRVYLLDYRKTKILKSFRPRDPQMTDIRMFLKEKLKKEYARFTRKRTISAKEIYDPNKGLLIGQTENMEINSFTKAEHFKARSPETDLEHYHDFMKNFFEDQASIDVVEKWVAFSLQGKNLTHLLLKGVKGCGKTFFADNLLKALHGDTNHHSMSGKSGRSAFDTPDYTKTLVFVDECLFNNEELKSDVKYKLNKNISYNIKFQVNEGSRRTFANYVYACNYAASVRVELDDRCLTIPNVTPYPASANPGLQKPLARLLKLLNPNHREYLRYTNGIYNYLVGKYPVALEDYGETELEPIEFFSKTFRKLVIETDSQPRKMIYEHAMSKAAITAIEIQRDLAMKKIPVTCDDFLIKATIKTFKDRFGFELATWDKDSGGYISQIYEKPMSF